MRSFRALAAGLAALALAACGLNPSGSGTGTTLRVANLIPGSTAVSVTVGGTPFMTAAPFETVTPYQDITAGLYTFNISVAGTPAPIYTATNTLTNISAFTFIPYGSTINAGGMLLTDTLLTNVPTGNFGFRLANVSPTAGAIDAYLTAPGADLNAASPVVPGLVYGNSSAFVHVPLGTYRLRIVRAGTKEVIYDGTLPPATDTTGQTVVAYSRGSARLVNVLALTANAPSTYVANRLAQLKAVNASSVASPLNVFVDGALTLANIPYTGVSNYQGADAGTRAISVEAAATPGATLLSISPTLGVATDTSIAFYGGAGSLAALVLADSNVSTLTTKASVRFVNVAPGLPAADVYANGTRVASGVAPNSASGYVLLDASVDGTTYAFDFDPAGTTTPALTLSGVKLVAANVYTIYVVGAAGALQGIVVQDY